MSDPIIRLNTALEGRYRVESELGEGGMARVYLANDVKHDREVALKVLKPELGEALGTERFLREIEIASKLSHPHILPVFDSGEAQGLFYLVMPYVRGESLRDRLDREGPLPLDEAVTVASEIADALGYAHESGLVHRDIKPENILFQSGHATVTDFGIAVATSEDADTRLTRTGMAVGTVAYMSPEQAAGDKEIDARSDIYSLGCILFEMLEGQRPFAGKSPQAVLSSKLTGKLPEFTRADDRPETLRPVLDRALAPDPDDRHPDARQFVTELRTALTATEIEAARARRQRRTIARGIGAAGVVAALGFGSWWATGAVGGPSIQSLALLPFENELFDAEQTALIAGLHLSLIGEMQQAGLRLPSRRSVIRYLGESTSVAEIGAEQGADAVLEGRAEYGEDSVSVMLQMTDVRSPGVRWSRTFQSATRDVVTLQREIARTVADEVGLELTDEVAARLATASQVDPRSHQLALRGNYHIRRLTPQDLEVAEGLFRQALEIDPDNALALGGLAWVWAGRQQFGIASPVEARPLIRDYQARALALAPNDPTLIAANALILTWVEWDWEAAGVEFERALQLNPSDWETRAYYSHYLVFMGRLDEARIQAELAREGDPFSSLIISLANGAVSHLGDDEAALEAAGEALRLDPSQPVAHHLRITALHGLGRPEEAARAQADLFSIVGDTALANAMYTGLDAGGPQEASARAAAILEARAELVYIAPSQIGLAHLWAGNIERALDWFERGEAIRDPQLPYTFGSPTPASWGVEAFVAHPRFQAIRERMGLAGRRTSAGS
jgi:TolB-like protein/Tfp pilus assembly protein PilF